ncbi:oligosaccharyl transferase, archaeosortase A system-associated [Halobacteriales archaeon SW_7_68_16]|nr:MAG: oligosaccharyl transferase, archaeosortase A system-associated [Halobacteriales archaeon SW_7_68_16]
MSQPNESAHGEETASSESVLATFGRWYTVPAVGAIMAFMLWVRLQAMDRFVRGGDVFFAGNDAYYHFRAVSYTVRNFPSTITYETWTRFPTGTYVGQFGTLFDQLIATAALIVGLGSPSDQTIAMTVLVAPAVFGALVAVPVYFAGRRLGGRGGAVGGVLLLALLPGTFLRRSTVGFADHHVAEVLLQTAALAATMVALGVAARDKPIYTQFFDRSAWSGLRPTVLWSAAAGLLTALYMSVWPPGVVFVGILGIFFVVGVSLDSLTGRSPEHLAIVGVVMGLVTAVLTAVQIEVTSFGAAAQSLLQPVLALSLAVGAASLAVVSRVLDRRDAPAGSLVGVVVTVGAIGFGLVAVALPGLFNTIVNNATRAFLLGQSDTTLTIAEAQSYPLDRFPAILLGQYGLAYISAFVGLAGMVGHVLLSEEYEHEILLVAIWFVMLTLMAFTQRRFQYYLAAGIVLSNAYVIGVVIRRIGFPSLSEDASAIKAYHVLTVLIIGIVLLSTLVVPPANVVAASTQTGPSSSVIWDESGDWMQANTPAPGKYANPDGEALDYYGTTGLQDDLEYPEGAYGVVSWWDYGHWITVEAERIPIANPFQENARAASSFLQANTEARANAVLEALPSTNPSTLDEKSTADIESIVADRPDQEAGEDTRFVMIDDQTVGGKFGAVTQWSTPPDVRAYQDATPGDRFGAYYNRTTVSVGENETAQLLAPSDRYRDAIISELYFEDATGLEHYRLVHETDRYSIVGSRAIPNQRAPGGFVSRPLDSIRPNTAAWRNGWTQDIQNISTAVSRGRSIPVGSGQFMFGANVEATVKTFERVPGATVSGTVERNNTTVSVGVPLQADTGRTFRYTQRASVDDDGRFSVTVPYATDNALGPADGYTNTSVVPTGNYTVASGFISLGGQSQPIGTLGTFDVPERAVVEGGTVDAGALTPPEPPEPPQDGNATDASGRVTPIAP